MPRNNRIEKLGMNVLFMWYPRNNRYTLSSCHKYKYFTTINACRRLSYVSTIVGVSNGRHNSNSFTMSQLKLLLRTLPRTVVFFSTSFGRFHRFVTFKLSRKKNFPCSKLLLCAKQREYLNTYAMRCTAVATTVAMVASKQPHKVYCVGAMCMSLNVFVKNRQWNWNCNMLNSQLNLSIDSVETP